MEDNNKQTEKFGKQKKKEGDALNLKELFAIKKG